jgi:hypothetical protein
MSRQKIYQTMQGKQIDIDLLRKRNELTPAVGNARVNARGDELGPGGKIVKKREDSVKAYYQTPNAVNGTVEEAETPLAEEVVAEKPKARTTQKAKTPAQVAKEQEELDAQEEWVEDEDGNFVKRGN